MPASIKDQSNVRSSRRRMLAADPLPSFASARWASAMAAKAAGHLRAGSERLSHKSRVPVSRRSCGPAIDPQETSAVLIALPKSCRSGPARAPEEIPRR